MRDLRPYVCLYEQCAAGDQLFDTFQSWRTHQLEHEPAPASSALSMPMGQDSRQCPLCLADGKTWVHIAVHLQRIATFALPTLLPDEDGDRSFADVSNQAADFDSPDGSNQAANFDDSSSGAGTQVTDPPVREQTGLVCGKCYMSRPSDELQFCAQCFDLPDAFSSYYCRNFCSSAECGHAKDCNVSGHLPCWVEHKRQTSHEPHNSGPTEEGIQTLPLTDKVHNATVMLDYLKGTAGVSTSVLPTQYSAVGESSAVGEFSAAEAAGAHDAVGYEAMLNQYHKLEQQVMMENMIMQGADLPQAFWNPLESMSKKDVTS